MNPILQQLKSLSGQVKWTQINNKVEENRGSPAFEIFLRQNVLKLAADPRSALPRLNAWEAIFVAACKTVPESLQNALFRHWLLTKHLQTCTYTRDGMLGNMLGPFVTNQKSDLSFDKMKSMSLSSGKLGKAAFGGGPVVLGLWRITETGGEYLDHMMILDEKGLHPDSANRGTWCLNVEGISQISLRAVLHNWSTAYAAPGNSWRLVAYDFSLVKIRQWCKKLREVEVNAYSQALKQRQIGHTASEYAQWIASYRAREEAIATITRYQLLAYGKHLESGQPDVGPQSFQAAGVKRREHLQEVMLEIKTIPLPKLQELVTEAKVIEERKLAESQMLAKLTKLHMSK